MNADKRMTVVLPAADEKAMSDFCKRLSKELGSRVTRTDLLRALADVLRDPNLHVMHDVLEFTIREIKME